MSEKTQLRTALKQIGERFFSFQEFPTVERSRLPEGVVEEAAEIRESEVDFYSASLSGKELEAMILDFPGLYSKEERERVGAILASRFSPRLINLIFNLYQVQCHSEALRFLIRKFAEEADRRKQFPDEGRFFWNFGKSDDYFPGIKAVFRESINDLNELFQRYFIGEETPFAMEIRRICLEDADHELLHHNRKNLIFLIDNGREEFLPKAIENHIYSFEILDPSDEVNQAILNRMGEVSQSEKWEGYSEDTKKKFRQWCFCHQLKAYTWEATSKYRILSQYYEYVRQSTELENGSAFVIEFDTVVVVDVAGQPHSYFYLKADYDREFRQWQEFGIKPSFLLEDGVKVTARDHIILHQDAACIRLQYDGIDKLYIKELLDVKLGIVPDYHNMKLG